MIILNHPLIPSPKLTKITRKPQISNVPANEMVWIEFDMDLMRYCHDNDVHYAVTVVDTSQAVYANALKADFLMCGFQAAQKIQKVAEHYLFDAKVIAILDERVLYKAIEAGIDGVYLTNYTRTLSK